MIGFNKAESGGSSSEEVIGMKGFRQSVSSWVDGQVAVPAQFSVLQGAPFVNQSVSINGSGEVTINGALISGAFHALKDYTDCKVEFVIAHDESSGFDITGDLKLHLFRISQTNLETTSSTVTITSIANVIVTDLDLDERKYASITTSSAIDEGDKLFCFAENETGGTLNSFNDLQLSFVIIGVL